ncbi:MAG: hypothetical protein OJF47_001853 [Nitrospira sp.]|nr:MAG: hypothetical protein OJF47_001853 [Nitrospira sp.]
MSTVCYSMKGDNDGTGSELSEPKFLATVFAKSEPPQVLLCVN